ncbi:MAG: HEAT repeat domain-containing protein, partial [Candidatus Sulfotelmatobacter sp.]
VEDALLHPAGILDRDRLALAGSLGGLKDVRAIPGLTQLSEVADPTTRHYAASALRQTGSPAALPPLAKLLNDADFNTRYYAVAGLGEITHQDEWTPSLDEFRQHEDKCTSYWRHWVEGNVK